jgi:SAM-dependent methyltransferase
MGAELFHRLISARVNRRGLRVLDFGCGDGITVRELLEFGYDAHGCDVVSVAGERLACIETPYRLPYGDSTFDVCISNQVFEHVTNKHEGFREIARVLKPEGFGIHVLPSKWVPIEPHIFVPFGSWMWPHIPDAWLALWAILGVRNQFQHGLGWREVVRRNREYAATALNYWPMSRFRTTCIATFGSFSNLDAEAARFGGGRRASVLRAIPGGIRLAPLLALVSNTCFSHGNRGPAEAKTGKS